MANLDIEKPKRGRPKKTNVAPVSDIDMPMIQEGMDITDGTVINTFVVNTSFVLLKPLTSFSRGEELKLNKAQAQLFQPYLDKISGAK